LTHYKGIAAYYDLLMDAGYYDHKALATVVRSAIGKRKALLELGVGTGRLAHELLTLDSTYDLVGIDFSAAMVEIAKRRLPSRVPVIECDVAEMHLDRKFDVAISSGGTWVIIQSGNELQLGTHLFDHKKDLCGLQNVARHLDPGGLLLLSVHPPHEDRDLELSDGIVYSQTIDGRAGTSDHYSLEKSYYFKRNGTILAEETLTLGFYESKMFLRMLANVGFEPLGMTETEEFFIFEKAA
jgi:SAM-dependent methyltransferase